MMSKMIRTGVAFAALLAAPIAARAADIPRQSYKAPAYTAPAYFSWSGFYVGLNGGYGWGTANWAPAPGASVKTNGGLFGGTLGYNFQTGAIVWGAEGDWDFSTVKGTATGTATCLAPGCTTKLKWLATGRGRIGYAFDRWLPFITGGAAFGNVENTAVNGSETKSKLGWTAGAGVEYAFLGAWSAKVEYLYVDLGSVTCATCITGVPQTISYKVNLVRAGLNYRF
jgi:outer membrane immunogenic protein